MIDGDDGDSAIAEFARARSDLLGVRLVKTRRRFVENIEHIDKIGAERLGQLNAALFSGAERSQLAFERQVTEPDVAQIFENKNRA